MSITIKFVCDGDIRRTRMSALSLEEVLGAAQQAFPELAPGSFDMKYRDDEDDLCLLCSSTSPDFVALYQGSSSVRLQVVKKTSQSTTPAENTQQQSAPKQTNGGAAPTPTSSDGPSSVSVDGIQPPFAQIAEALLGNMHNSGSAHPGMPAFAPLLQQLLGHAAAHPGRASSHSQCGMPPFAQFLPQLLSGNADALAPLFVQLAPMLLQHLSSVPGALEKHAARKPEVARAVVQAVRNALEPFPQLHGVLSAADGALQSDSTEGLGQVVIDFLDAFTKLPQEQQHDIAPIVLGSVIEKVLPAVTAAMEEHMAEMQQPQQQMNANAHVGITCDGCNSSPIIGQRFKCMQCPDYDLCEACHARKGELHHQDHTFHSITQGDHADCGAASGFRRSCPWGKGFGKGFGKGWGKGWGKEGGWRRPHCWSKGWGKGDGSSSESDSMSDSSSGPAQSAQEMQFREQRPEAPERLRTRKEAKQAMQEAKRSCKLAIREAKKCYKADKKVAKHLFKEAKKASKDALKQEKTARNAGRKSPSESQEAEAEPAVPEAMEAMDTDSQLLTFPVIVADGRSLEISWRKGDDHNIVATSFAAQHNIMSDEIPTVLHFLAHAEQQAAAAEQLAATAEQHAAAAEQHAATAQRHTAAAEQHAATAEQHAAAVAASAPMAHAEQHAAAVAAAAPATAAAEDALMAETRVHPSDKNNTPYSYDSFLAFNQGDARKATQMWNESKSNQDAGTYKMEDIPASQDAPVYSFNDNMQLQALQAMGFTNHELNMELLAEHQGNLQQVLEKLL